MALTETFQHANPDLYPNVVTIITVLLTMPVSTATPEPSFSTMRRVKTYLRSTMRTEQLSALALMHAYRDMPIELVDTKTRSSLGQNQLTRNPKPKKGGKREGKKKRKKEGEKIKKNIKG